MAIAARQTSSFSTLLARYMQGEITDSIWSNLMRLFDADGVTSTERVAFARFVNDLVAEGGSTALYMPREKEASELLSATRA